LALVEVAATSSDASRTNFTRVLHFFWKIFNKTISLVPILFAVIRNFISQEVLSPVELRITRAVPINVTA
jgi:hypothetical protein